MNPGDAVRVTFPGRAPEQASVLTTGPRGVMLGFPFGTFTSMWVPEAWVEVLGR